MEGNARRAWLKVVGSAGALMLTALGSAYVVAQPAERIVRIRVKRFEFEPGEIALKKGEPVVLELTSEDVLMGINVPDLGVRADIVPGKVSLLRLVPQKEGRIEFHCDVFCGDGHEEMDGQFIVTA